MPNPQGSKPPHKETFGGFNTGTFYSGAVAPAVLNAPGSFATGSDVMIASGPGRLDSILLHQHTAQSGAVLPIVFYDAAAPVSGGPIPSSGHKLLAFTPFLTQLVSGNFSSSGAFGPTIPAFGVPVTIAVPFGSGLCFNSRSGQPGFSVAWSPEPANQ
jgi:hypothetical protein